jgi:tRNA-Thr(GGU) m(6)t(6)A37 methyltransferase TsaA
MNSGGNTQGEIFEIYPIGYIRQDEAGFYLEILGPFRDGLLQLDQFSHVKVYWWGHHSDNPEARATLQAELPYADSVTAGVFACRAEYRPNPILESICYLLEVDLEKGIVRLPWIDAFEGTPVLDLKPYIPISDRIRDVQVAEWLQMLPEWMEDAAEFFAAEGADFFD